MIHQIVSSKISLKIKGYIKRNYGLPFLLVFLILLMGASVFISTGLSYMANSITVYAFYALIIGVALQLVSFLKYKKTNETEAD
ncbi:MAG: hypothetical protein LBH74_08630 [Nitrososphaerota archaeon]|jgi:membrane protein CcdC involved in cytochrome C biogenesis|nr:hypothetical protein [Nitrososphaerota archaeon]